MARKSKMAKIEKPLGQLNARLYLRVSTDRQAEEGYSLGIQREKLQAYITTLDGDFQYEVVSDDGYSGGDLNRPGIQSIIREAEAGVITHVIVVKLDRLSRSLKDTIHLIEDVLLPNNVAFISLNESFDTSTPFGRAMIGILSVFAQFERENIYERTRSGMQKRVEAGYWPGGGRVPFGYNYDPAQGILVPNGDAEKVRAIYDQYLAGRGLQAIADSLGLKYEKVAYNILTRKANTGVIVYNDVEYQGRHEAIVSLETYEQAMDMLEERSKRKTLSKSPHLLAGLVVCGQCGARMRYAKWGKAGYKLTCYSRQSSKGYLVKDPNCQQEHVWAADVEKAVIDVLFTASAKGRLEQAQKSIQGGQLLEQLEQQLSQAKEKLRRLYTLYATAGDETLLEVIETSKQEVSGLEAQLSSEADRNRYIQTANRTFGRLAGLEDIWPYMAVAEQKSILASMIDSIEIHENSVDIKMKYDKIGEITSI